MAKRKTPEQEVLHTVKQRLIQQGVSRKVSDREVIDAMRDGFPLIQQLMKDPYSPAADQGLEETVDRYNAEAFNLIAAGDLLTHPRWPAWHRLLQVRFCNLPVPKRRVLRPSCGSSLKMRSAHHPTDSCGKFFGSALSTLSPTARRIRISRKHSGHLLASQMDLWQKAMKNLDEDMEQQNTLGRTIDEAPAEWYCVLGVDYSLKAIPN